MKCPSCGHGSRDAARFCDQCGTALRRAPLPYTPKHLADRILAAGRVLQGERKQVTVLFADVPGSTQLAQSLGAEDWHRVIDRTLRILAQGVHRFEGTVNQYTGDGIMALFGAPIAHEDHAQRACHAALQLSRDVAHFSAELAQDRGVELSVRIGLNSGEVVVGKIGDDLRMDYTAAGLTTHLADRVQKLATPGTALLGESTRRQVEGYFELRDLGERDLRGALAPVRVYELVGPRRARTRLEVAEGRGLASFAGREAQMAVLESALDRALAGDGQVVGVVGEPGVGKSRLCLEFASRCRSRGIDTMHAYCPTHGALAAELAPIFSRPGEDAHTRCIVVDDLQWIDLESEALLAELVEQVRGTYNLLLLISRPEYQARWMRDPHYRSVPIPPLQAPAARALLVELLGTDPSLEAVLGLLERQTGGNPFFVEELVAALVEQGVLRGPPGERRLVVPFEKLVVPDSVQALLAARIDRLPEHEKDLLLVASVLGQRFSARLLASVSERADADVAAALDSLSRANFVTGDVEYRIQHPLVREVAYGMQLGERRRASHERAARALEPLHPEHAEAQAARIAHHWNAAGNPEAAARWRLRAQLMGLKEFFEPPVEG